jgi:hypothetical protein
MYFKGFQHQLMETLALVLAVSFILHLIGIWLAPLLPVLLVVAVLAIVARLVFIRRH